MNQAFSSPYHTAITLPAFLWFRPLIKAMLIAGLLLSLTLFVTLLWQMQQLASLLAQFASGQARLAELNQANQTLEAQVAASRTTLPTESELRLLGFERPTQLHFLDLSANQVATQETFWQP